jgi:hypothetical protein
MKTNRRNFFASAIHVMLGLFGIGRCKRHRPLDKKMIANARASINDPSKWLTKHQLVWRAKTIPNAEMGN